MPALQNLTHQPAEAPFTSQGSQDLVNLLPHQGSFVSLLDLGIKYSSASSSSLFHFKHSSNDRLPYEAKCMISDISTKLMGISEQELCLCQFLLTYTVNHAKLNKSMLQRSPSHLAEKTVPLPRKLRKRELSLQGQRKSLPSSGSDHLVLEMIAMSHEYNVPK